MAKPTDDEEHIKIPEPIQRSNVGMIVGSVIALSVLGTGSIITIVLTRPNQDNAVLIATILGFLGSTSAALLALIKNVQTGTDVKELHLAVNKRLSQLLDLTAKAAHSLGREEVVSETTIEKETKTVKAVPLSATGATAAAVEAVDIAAAAAATVNAATETLDAATDTLDAAGRKVVAAKKSIEKHK